MQGKPTFLSGEICPRSGFVRATGAGLRPRPKGREEPPDPTAPATGVGLRPSSKDAESPPNFTADGPARRPETVVVGGQKSAEATVPVGAREAPDGKGRTS